MKKFWLVIIASAMLMSGCNNSELDSRSSSVSSSSRPVVSSTSENTASASESKPENSISVISTVSSSSTIKSPESSSTFSSNIKNPEPPANKEENALNITIAINGRNFSATLYDSETAKEFKSRLPLTLDMSELNGNEKYYYLPDSLPKNSSRPSMINAGDIMLYGSDCLVIFYESFSTSYSYTPIGKVDDPDGLAAALGSGDVQVAFYA